MRIVFMGTPDFAVEPLKALYNAGHRIELVLTREDKARGRGKELSSTPVKAEATKLGLTVITPTKIKDEELIDRLKAVEADVFIVVAYGKILPKEVLSIPRYGCINIHASLLPAYRGAAPIQKAIMDGQSKTGITTMLMDEGLDTGDILKQYEIDMKPDDTGGSLFDKLAICGANAIIDTLDDLASDKITPKKQGDATTEYASMLTKDMGDIDWTKNAIEIERHIRAFDPWPTAYTHIDGKTLKIWGAHCSDNKTIANPGTITLIDKEGMHVSTGTQDLIVTSVQIEGKKRMDVLSWIRGYNPAIGSKLISNHQ